MRIILVSAASSVHTIRWANSFAASSIKVHLVSQHPPLEPLDERVAFHQFPHLKGLGYFVNGPRLSRLIRKIKPDLVNIHYASGLGILGHWVKGAPYVLNVWGSDVYDFPYRSPIHGMLIRANLRRADAVASTSHAMADQVRRLCPDIQDIEITPFGVDTSRFSPQKSTHDPTKVVLGTVKVLAHKYGIDTLLETFALLQSRIRDQRIQLELRIVGDGPQRVELETLARRLGIQDTTVFVGWVPHEQIPQQLAALDIYCALSRLDSESFGVAIIEASACGLPVLVSDAGGLPEVVLSGKTGIIVPRENPEAASRALEHLIKSPGEREEMGRVGVDHVANNYEWHVCLDRVAQFFQKITMKN